MSRSGRSLAPDVIHGVLWMYASRYGAKFLVFLSTVILARLLSREDFGVAAYAFVFIGFMEAASELGIQQALIYFPKQEERTNTAFWLGLGVGALAYALAFAVAPVTGWLFADPRAVSVFRVLALALPISSLALVHEGLLRKDLVFDRQLVAQGGQALSKGLVSIALALAGFEYWSLVLGHVGGVLVSVALFWWVIRWRPKLRFDSSYVRPLLSYGLQIAFNLSLSLFLLDLDFLLIGHFMGAAVLGVYSVAFRVPDMLIRQFSAVVGSVVFPVYVRMREQGQPLAHGLRVTMQYANLATMPMGVGLALVAEPFMLVVFTDKWADGIPVVRAIALYSLLRASVFNLGDLYKALGLVHLLGRIRVAQALVTIPALWWSAATGSIVQVAWTQVALAFTLAVVHLVVASRVLRTPILSICASFRPALTGVAVMSLAVLGFLRLTSDSAPAIQLLAGASVGALAYVGALWGLHRGVVVEGAHALWAALRQGRRRP